MRINLIIEKYEKTQDLYSSFLWWFDRHVVSISIFLDHVIDPTTVLDRIWCVAHDHIRRLTRSIYMYIPEAEYRLEDTCCMGIHLLDTVETTLCDAAWECWDLLYTDHARVGDDEEIEFVIDPVEEYKCEKKYPIYRESSPVDRSSEYLHDRSSIGDEYPWAREEGEEVEKVKY